MTVVSVELRSTDGSACVSRERLSTGRVPPQPARPPSSSVVAPRPARSLCRMGLIPDGLRDRQHRHADAEVRARVLAVDDLDGAAVRIYEFEHHREADARALDLNSGGRPTGIEGLEHARAFFL